MLSGLLRIGFQRFFQNHCLSISKDPESQCHREPFGPTIQLIQLSLHVVQWVHVRYNA